MRTLYLMLLRLYPTSVREEFGDEMLGVFEDAAADARARGFVSYLRFCLREVFGLLFGAVVRDHLVRHRRWMIRGAIAGALLAGVAAAAVGTRPFTSTALIRVVPQQIPERFVVAHSSLTIQTVMPVLSQTITSRGAMAGIINTYNLYPEYREEMPLEDVIELMRKEITIEAEQEGMRVSFRYPDRILAQKVTADLVSRIMTEYIRQRTTMSVLTTQFLRDQTEEAARQWEDAVAVLEAKKSARAQLDVQIARQHYETLSARLRESSMSDEMERRQQGPTLELVDPASLPRYDHPYVVIWASWGALGGIAAGWLVSLLLSLRTRRVLAEVR